ncbi:MAG: hypothetical protein ACI8XV_002639 [Arenicella sp.]|jgi:hypothetical protein
MLKTLKRSLTTLAFACVLISSSSLLVTNLVHAKGVQFNILSSTPIGSWQLREDTTTDSKGRAQVSVLRTSMLAKEPRNGEDHYWVEMEMNSFKVSKKGKRKASGDAVIFKVLIAQSAFNSNPGNIMMNLQGFGAEMIMQSGKSDPMRMTGGGGFMGGLMKSLGVKVNHDFQDLGQESVSVAAGDFDANKIQGSGTTTAKILFQSINVASDSTAWLSSKVPFGIVKSEGTSTTNGKASTHSSQLLEYGLSGAVSKITKTPQEMPKMPDLGGLFKN